MANGHGGKRSGAGRKPREERFAPQIERGDADFAAFLDTATQHIIELAEGAELIHEFWQPAALVFVNEYEIVETERGPKVLKTQVRAFPALPDDQEVLVKRTVTKLPPDFKANSYIVDRTLGKVAPRVELEETPEESALPDTLQAEIDKAYREPEPDEEEEGDESEDDAETPSAPAAVSFAVSSAPLVSAPEAPRRRALFGSGRSRNCAGKWDFSRKRHRAR